jgi:hypothetical protein
LPNSAEVGFEQISIIVYICSKIGLEKSSTKKRERVRFLICVCEAAVIGLPLISDGVVSYQCYPLYRSSAQVEARIRCRWVTAPPTNPYLYIAYRNRDE